MKKYIRAAKEIPVGTRVEIKTGMYRGEWGTVRYYDGEYYHVALWDGNDCPIFERSELKEVIK